MIEDVPLSLSGIAVLAPDVGVSIPKPRRRFTTAYKQDMVAAAARCTQRGELGALLRHEGLYASHIAVWRAAAERGELTGTGPRSGPKPGITPPDASRIATLEREVQRQTARAERAELIVEVQKKVAQLLELAAGPSSERS